MCIRDRALIVAETLMQARDAAELVDLSLDELPVAMDPTPGGATIHPEAPGNLAFDYTIGDAQAVAAALATSAHRIDLTVIHNRIIAVSYTHLDVYKRQPEGLRRSGAVKPRICFGPTCDSVDRLPGDIPFPADIAEGDFVIMHGMGAYSTVTNSRFNGFGELGMVTVLSLKV